MKCSTEFNLNQISDYSHTVSRGLCQEHSAYTVCVFFRKYTTELIIYKLTCKSNEILYVTRKLFQRIEVGNLSQLYQYEGLLFVGMRKTKFADEIC